MIKPYIYSIILFLMFISISSCSTFQYEEEDIESFNALCKEIDRTQNNAFIFFTDPHIDDVRAKLFDDFIKPIYKYYTYLDLDFCICGVDWLNNSDTQQEAIQKLEDIDNAMSIFGDRNYYPVLGNHDTNYQGKLNQNSIEWSGKLPHETLVELLFKKYRQTYYSYSSKGTKFYILDSGLDTNQDMDMFRWDQINWLGTDLLNITEQYIVLVIHIYTNDGVSPESFAKNIMELAEAYNESTHITLNDISYDFSYSKGKIGCIICGHCHFDFINNTNSIPVIGTTHLKDGGISSFDICLLDWDSNKLHMYRVGSGSNRIINLAK